MGRILQVAKQCQLLTGSYSGATRSCNCPDPQSCRLTKLHRLKYNFHPDVVAAANRNLQEYNASDQSTPDLG
jgi:hypothetical protein